MKRTHCFRTLAVLLALVLALGSALPAAAATPEDALSAQVDATAAYLLKTVTAPTVGSVGGEWSVISLARSGYDVPQAYWDNYYAGVEDYVRACKGVLHNRKYTEYSRLVVALTAIGADPHDVAGYDLLRPLGDFKATIWQGINGPIWALIALDCGGYDVPLNPEAEVQATRQMYVDEILSRQLNDGGWNLSSRGGDAASDPDITGMALQALAKYQDQAAVRSATDKALTCLSQMQDERGGYSNWGEDNTESTVQVITGLCELGIPVDDSRFVKNGHTLLDALALGRLNDGSYEHVSGGGSNLMSTEQSLYGLVAALRAQQGKSSLYRCDDVTIRVSGTAAHTNGLPGKHADVQKVPVSAPGTSFSDIQGHANQAAIEALASRGIITGKSADTFDPNATMTRAQFATIVVRALGLGPKEADAFSDVVSGSFYAPFIGSAYSYGLVNGVGEGKFNPDGTITRQQAAVLVQRAAELCGLTVQMDETAVRNMLAQFGDYRTAADWATSGLAFCYQTGILDQADLNIEPTRDILRCEIAQMLYNLLEAAELL